jgi:hypothetical protein
MKAPRLNLILRCYAVTMTALVVIASAIATNDAT